MENYIYINLKCGEAEFKFPVHVKQPLKNMMEMFAFIHEYDPKELKFYKEDGVKLETVLTAQMMNIHNGQTLIVKHTPQ